MDLLGQNIVCLTSEFNKDDLSIDSLRNIFDEMPMIQTPMPIFPDNNKLPISIILPTIIDFQLSGMKIVASPDRLEISQMLNIQLNFAEKVKSFLNSVRKDYFLTAFGFNFDFTMSCTNNLKQIMEINTKLTSNYADTIINQIRYTLNHGDILYVVDFIENLPNLNIHVNCHFSKEISIFNLAEEVERDYDRCYQEATQLVQKAIGD